MPPRSHHGGRTVYRVSFSLIAAVFLVLSTSVAVGVAYQLHQLSVNALKHPPAPQYLVVLVLDGAQPSYLHSMPLPHLDAIRNAGVEYSQAFAGILESETPAGHATLSTGSTPAKSGMLGFNWIKSDNSPVRLFNPDVVRAGGMEHVLQQAGAPTIASLFKARYPHAKVVAVSGHKYYAVDPLGGPLADYILYYAPDAKNRYVPTAIPGHVPPQSLMNDPALATQSTTLPLGAEDSLAVKLAMASFRKVRQQVTLINIPEFDWPLGHVYGGEASRVRTLMQDFDRDLGVIEDTYRKAGVLDRTMFVVTADHGMSSLAYQIPDSVLDDSVTASGTTSLETTYSTAGYIWLQDSSKSQLVADTIVAKKAQHVQSVYYKVTSKAGDGYVRASGLDIPPQVDSANQYLLRSFLGGNAPEVVAFCTENAGFVKSGAETWKGNHGGGSWGSQHIPLVMSGPGIVQARVIDSPARLEDVAPTALSLFGIKATAMQGSVLAGALQNPSTAQTRTEKSLDASLTPVISALQIQSRNELVAASKQ
jgi:arylsulfatase A-like enzyme